jgi:hypothetical protein
MCQVNIQKVGDRRIIVGTAFGTAGKHDVVKDELDDPFI